MAYHRIAVLSVILLSFGTSAGDWLVAGRVVDPAYAPVAGATVRLRSAGLEAVSDSAGAFVLEGSGSAAHRFATPPRAVISFDGARVTFGPASGRRVEISLFGADGRRLLYRRFRPAGAAEISTPLPGNLAGGCYVCRVTCDGTTVVNRAVRIASGTIWQQRRIAMDGGGALGKRAAPALDSVVASLSGYEDARASVTNDTTLGVLLRLSLSGSAASEAVTVVETTLTFPIDVVLNTKALNADDGLYPPAEGFIVDNATSRHQVIVRDDINAVVLSNGLIRVVVSPSLGMRVMSATDLTLQKEFFHSKDTLQGYRVWDVGGVEASWPMYEHGLHMLNEPGATMSDPRNRPLQSAGYRIVRESDGSVVVAMNMRFEIYNSKSESALQGRYSDRPLSSWVRVTPGRSAFTTSYRVDNPNPTRRSDRLWNDALFVKGTPDSRIIMPVRWATDHATDGIYDLDTARYMPASFYYDASRKMYSMFGLYPRYPFCGVYYPAESTNRVRIHDPKTAPGMKCFVHGGVPFIEFWGGTGAVFEDPGSFVGAWEPTEFENSYYMTADIGMLSYANDVCAIGVDTAANTFKLTAPVAYAATVEDFAGTQLAAGTVGPGKAVLTGNCSARQIVVKAGGREVLRASFPLVYEDNLAELDSVRRRCVRSLTAWKLPALTWGKTMDNRRGFNYELEMLPNNTYVLRDYHGLMAASVATSADTPEYLLSLARVCYRHKRFAKALELCAMVDGKGAEFVAHADFLKGLIAWERGGAVDFGTAGVESNYHRALLAIGAAERNEAVTLLEEMCTAYPKAYRPALALAYLRGERAAAGTLASRNPGSPEALAVLGLLGDAAAAEDADRLLVDNPGAAESLAAFKAEITAGAWAHVTRWPHIPSGTKYGVSD